MAAQSDCHRQGRHEWRIHGGIHLDVEPRSGPGAAIRRLRLLSEGQPSEEGRATHTVDAPGDGVLLAGFRIELDVPVAEGDGRDGCHADQSSSGNYDAVKVPRPKRQSHDRQVWDVIAHNPSRGNAAVRKGRNVGVLDKILRAGEGKTLRKLESIAKAVNSIEEDYTSQASDLAQRGFDDIEQLNRHGVDAPEKTDQRLG